FLPVQEPRRPVEHGGALSQPVSRGLHVRAVCDWRPRLGFPLEHGVGILRPRILQSVVITIALLVGSTTATAQKTDDYLFNDSHFHLTNYIQEGINIHDFLKIMGNKAGRVA